MSQRINTDKLQAAVVILGPVALLLLTQHVKGWNNLYTVISIGIIAFPIFSTLIVCTDGCPSQRSNVGLHHPLMFSGRDDNGHYDNHDNASLASSV